MLAALSAQNHDGLLRERLKDFCGPCFPHARREFDEPVRKLFLVQRGQLRGRGIALEQLALDLNSVVNENPYFQKANKGQAGCQIDRVIQTKFHTLYVCEIRFSAKPIGTGIIKEVEEKIKRLKRPKNYSCRPVLIHINGVTQEVADSDYCAAIIDMGQQLMVS